jgi:hypothetical protein
VASRWGSGRRGGGRHAGREEGRWRSGRRSSIGGATADDGAAAVHGRRGGALAEDGDGPRGEGAGPSRMTVGRSWTWVGHSWRTAGWSEGRRRSGTTAAFGGKIWQPDSVVSYSRQTLKIFETVSRVYIDGITTGGPHEITTSGRLVGHIKQPPAVNLTTGG